MPGKIGIVYTTSEANSVSTIETYKNLAGQYGFEIVEKGISNAAELPQAMDILAGEADCISNMTDNTVVNNLPVVLEKAGARNIPVFGSEEEQVGNGCIASAGIDYIELGKKAGRHGGAGAQGREYFRYALRDHHGEQNHGKSGRGRKTGHSDPGGRDSPGRGEGVRQIRVCEA